MGNLENVYANTFDWMNGDHKQLSLLKMSEFIDRIHKKVPTNCRLELEDVSSYKLNIKNENYFELRFTHQKRFRLTHNSQNSNFAFGTKDFFNLIKEHEFEYFIQRIDYVISFKMYQNEVIFINDYDTAVLTDINNEKVYLYYKNIKHKIAIRSGKHRPFCIKIYTKTNAKQKRKNRYISARTMTHSMRHHFLCNYFYMIHTNKDLRFLNIMQAVQLNHITNRAVIKFDDLKGFFYYYTGIKLPNKLLILLRNFVSEYYGYYGMNGLGVRNNNNSITIPAEFVKIKNIINSIPENDLPLLYQNLKKYENIFRFSLYKEDKELTDKYRINVQTSNKRRIIIDTIVMVLNRNEMLNLRTQSFKKLEELHDRIAAEERLKSIPEINVQENFLKIEEILPDWEVIKTKERLLKEGIHQRNCVTGYANFINEGNIGIISFQHENERYTMELEQKRRNGFLYFYNKQLQGRFNKFKNLETRTLVTNEVEKKLHYLNQKLEELEL